MTTATKIRSKLNTNKSKSTLSNTVHWIINKELKQYETDLMEQLNITKRTQLYGHILKSTHEMLMPRVN